ncbi:MAG TPA: hypothetical protein DD730_15380, partial [Desulfosporosinus sp.]|nr:hypothetical protein [Desulfosporosinus sp.]
DLHLSIRRQRQMCIRDRDKEVILAIQDEGKGIKPEIMKRLGTPFITTKEKGTGLGLAVCFGIAARHKAEIIAVTSPQGSTFFMKFPLVGVI